MLQSQSSSFVSCRVQLIRFLLSMCRYLIYVSALFSVAHARGMSSNDFGKWFSGDGTYYGWTNAGNCAIRQVPKVYANLPAVAINNDQYMGSSACGACVQYIGSGKGSGANPIVGTHIAYVHDRCPECHHGSLDLSRNGDGRWQIRFQFVPCPFEDQLSFLMEGSHKYYIKLQARGLKYPVQGVECNGIVGIRSQDNFFIMQNGGGHRMPAVVYVVDVMSRKYRAIVDRIANEEDIKPRSVQRLDGSPSHRPPKRKRKPTKAPRARCVPTNRFCGPKSGYPTSRCCGKADACMRVPGQPTFRCMYRWARRCVPKGRRCVWGRRNHRPYPCCGGASCYRQRWHRHAGCW